MDFFYKYKSQLLTPWILFCFLVASLHTSAKETEEQTSLSLQTILISVRDFFPLIQLAQQDRKLADADLLTARGSFDPQVSLRFDGAPLGYYQNGRLDFLLQQPTPLWGTTFYGGYRLGFGHFPLYDGKYETNSAGELRAGVQIPLWRNGPIDRRRADIQKAEAGQVIADTQVLQQQLESQRAAAYRYFEWVIAGHRLFLAKSLLEIAMKRGEGLTERAKQGDLPKIEQIDNQRTIFQRQQTVIMAQRILEQATIELSLFLRNDQGEPALVPPAQLPQKLPELLPIPRESITEAVAAAFVKRPDLMRLKAQKKQVEIEKNWAKNQMAPALSLQAGVSKDFGPGSPTLEPFVIEGGVSLEFTIPNRAAKGRIQSAHVQTRRIELQEKFLQDRIRADLQDHQSALQASLQRVVLQNQEIQTAEQVEQAEKTKFQMGDSNILFVNLREQTTAESKLRLFEAWLDYHRAWVSYQAALARPLLEEKDKS